MRNQVPLDTQEIPVLTEDESVLKLAAEATLTNHISPGDNGVVNNPDMKQHVIHQDSERYLREILSHIKEISAKGHIKERDDVIMQEWKSVAKVVDRTFFWIAFGFTMIAVPVLLFHQDTSHE